MNTLEMALTPLQRRAIRALDTPFKIQQYLDKLPYPAELPYHCPSEAIRRGKAHCFDGALLGAALLRRIGYPPLIAYLIADRDDDHLLALYKVEKHWGAVAKSNCVGLRFREPVYRTLRELMMSYFEQFFNLHGEKSLRSYTVPLNLSSYDRRNWMTSNEPLEDIADRLDELRTMPLISKRMVRRLSAVDKKSYRAGMLGANPAGLYRPDKDE